MLNLLRRESDIQLDVREAITRPQSFNAERRTVEAVIASATPVQRMDARGPYWEILDPAGLDLEASRGATVLDSHKQTGIDNVLGVLDAVRIEGSEVIGTIRLTERPEKQAIIGDIRSGIVSKLSAGYAVPTWKDGTDAQGRRTKTATAWTIHECSFVPVAADPSARTRSADKQTRKIIELATRAHVDPAAFIHLPYKEAKEEIMNALINRTHVPLHTAHNRQTLDDPQNFIRAASDALLARTMPGHKPAPEAMQFVGLNFAELARTCLHRAGVNTMGLSGPVLIERAFMTTSDYPLLLVDAINKQLRPSYEIALSPIRKLARESTAVDFKTKHKLMLDSSSLSLEPVTETGEFRSGTMTEGDATFKLGTYGRILGLSRQALINDDLSAFSTIAARLGQAAASFEAGFIVNLVTSNPVMADGQRVFSAAHGNVAQSGAAPSDTTLSAARLAMRRQTGLDGEALIIVEPMYVVVPPELETSTEKVLTEIRAIKTDDVNVFALLKLIVDPRLTDPKAWYVWSDPAKMEGIEVAYLAGQPGVQIESRVGFSVDGMQVKARLDFGGGWIDHRGAYYNPGQ